MTLHVALTHRTLYRYDHRVTLGPHVVRLRPAPHCRTPILAYSLRITPDAHVINWQQDPFGNFAARAIVQQQSAEFSATVDLIADMAPINPFDFFVEQQAATWPFAYPDALAKDLAPYLETLPGDVQLDTFLGGIDATPRPTVAFVCDVNRTLCTHIAYRTRMEPGVQTPAETLATRSGSCRDTGWLLVQILRRLGLASRFVSGYLIQLRSDDGEDGTREDSADLHAWAEAYLPGAGWIGLDPTSGLLAGEGHIPLAATPSPTGAAPIEGSHAEAQVDFSVTMQVHRMRQTPSVAAPYSDPEWQQILNAGAEVERRLQAGDMRLSMGGEPTFVALEHREAAEWNLAAIGPTKREYGDGLARNLRDRFAKDGLLHYGQGKWYPGEAEPRWSHAIYWRRDREPLWRDAGLIAVGSKYTATNSQAAAFASALCQELGLGPDSPIAAYEDAAHFMLIEQKLPIGAEPGSGALGDPAERERLVRALDRGLDQPAGWIVPLLVVRGANGVRRLVTERWEFRRGRLFLVPGSSPIGLRLPLAGLPEINFVDYPHVTPADPFADGRPLPSFEQRPTCSDMRESPDADFESRRDTPACVRTALAVELRDGQICVFLPPLADGEDYAALVAAIEATAAKTCQPIHLEGYAPPFDARLAVIKVTPDPGVIEVNVHPATSWDEVVAITTGVYEEAEKIGLGTEKFSLAGRQLGTGGGGHIVVGGMTPSDSPFLRRPDLLASIIAYWQNHPALSYMFAGQFVGPTSQAPRADEGRREQLYELEIALAQVPGPGGDIAPWLVDRLFRNLLVDITGNTHRSEICIDKLYAPEGPMGRLGLVEFRAFEMPPHAHMGLAQQLLVRALLAWFWEQPYRRPLVRWDTTLHDRFMLPHFLWSDFISIIDDLQNAGMPLQAAWFAPHFEFRFPVLGTCVRAGVTLELRQALEPWLVLGEQSGAGTTRMVDSSLDRLQVRVSKVAGDRYTVACNGYRLPLAATGAEGEAVAGVRFRAWRTSEGFHPNIAPHVPLTFDILDTWNSRSTGGCRYHVTHPRGHDFHSRPVNARDAEARQRALFEPIGHTPGVYSVKPAEIDPEFPLTLDLRRMKRTS